MGLSSGWLIEAGDATDAPAGDDELAKVALAFTGFAMVSSTRPRPGPLLAGIGIEVRRKGGWYSTLTAWGRKTPDVGAAAQGYP